MKLAGSARAQCLQCTSMGSARVQRLRYISTGYDILLVQGGANTTGERMN
jgi:hypothetical protein